MAGRFRKFAVLGRETQRFDGQGDNVLLFVGGGEHVGKIRKLDAVGAFRLLLNQREVVAHLLLLGFGLGPIATPPALRSPVLFLRVGLSSGAARSE
jgi:hypothetical protein